MKTRRARMREVLARADEGLTLDELARIFEIDRRVALADLRHLQLTLRHRRESLLMAPSLCTTCGFVFAAEEPRAPSKCPACKRRTLTDPVFKVEEPAQT